MKTPNIDPEKAASSASSNCSANLRGDYKVGFAVGGREHKGFATSHVVVTALNGAEANRMVRRCLSEVRKKWELHQRRSIYFLHHADGPITSDDECRRRIVSAVVASRRGAKVVAEELARQGAISPNDKSSDREP